MNDYPYVLVYRGIQKPLEFMGLRGRYVYIGAGIAVVAILLFIVGFILVGLLFSFILLCWNVVLFLTFYIVILFSFFLARFSMKRRKGVGSTGFPLNLRLICR